MPLGAEGSDALSCRSNHHASRQNVYVSGSAEPRNDTVLGVKPPTFSICTASSAVGRGVGTGCLQSRARLCGIFERTGCSCNRGRRCQESTPLQSPARHQRHCCENGPHALALPRHWRDEQQAAYQHASPSAKAAKGTQRQFITEEGE